VASNLGKAPSNSALLQLELNILTRLKVESVRSELPEDGDGDCVAIARAQSVGGDVQQENSPLGCVPLVATIRQKESRRHGPGLQDLQTNDQ